MLAIVILGSILAVVAMRPQSDITVLIALIGVGLSQVGTISAGILNYLKSEEVLQKANHNAEQIDATKHLVNGASERASAAAMHAAEVKAQLAKIEGIALGRSLGKEEK